MALPHVRLCALLLVVTVALTSTGVAAVADLPDSPAEAAVIETLDTPACAPSETPMLGFENLVEPALAACGECTSDSDCPKTTCGGDGRWICFTLGGCARCICE